ncbi:MAG TPA: cupin domain-containing protein [Solirubrobacteraceae bacterium]|jgi:mannose-6-phosphate isomerase-like protein (cupin superfamily)
MSGYTIRHIDQMQALHHGSVKLAGAELGVESFGMQLLDLPARFSEYPEHDHADDGQEEVYVVLRGSGEFEIDGDRVAIDAGRMLRIDPDSRRKLWPGHQGLRILAIGCAPTGAYQRPEHFRLEVRS